MADDAAAPDGELSESTATEETSSAIEPESGGSETAEAAETDRRRRTATRTATPTTTRKPPTRKPGRPSRGCRTCGWRRSPGWSLVVALAGLTGWLGFRAYQSHQADEQRKLFLQVGQAGCAEPDHDRLAARRRGRAAHPGLGDRNLLRRLPEACAAVRRGRQAGAVEVGRHHRRGGAGVRIRQRRQVLVAVTVKTSNAGAPEQAPRAWRMRISVQKVGDEAKVSNVEFVP